MTLASSLLTRQMVARYVLTSVLGTYVLADHWHLIQNCLNFVFGTSQYRYLTEKQKANEDELFGPFAGNTLRYSQSTGVIFDSMPA